MATRWDAAFVRAVEHSALEQAEVDALSHALAALTSSEERKNLRELHLTRLEFLADQWHPLGPPLGAMHVSGDTVILQNLQARPELNGTKHYIRKYDAAAGRYAVHSVDGKGEQIRVKPLNLLGIKTREVHVEQWYGLDKLEPIQVLRDRARMQPKCGPGLGLDQPRLRREREQASPEQQDDVLQRQAIQLEREALARYVTGWCEHVGTAGPQTAPSQPMPRASPTTRVQATAKVEREAKASGAAAQLNASSFNVHAAAFVPGAPLHRSTAGTSAAATATHSNEDESAGYHTPGGGEDDDEKVEFFDARENLDDARDDDSAAGRADLSKQQQQQQRDTEYKKSKQRHQTRESLPLEHEETQLAAVVAGTARMCRPCKRTLPCERFSRGQWGKRLGQSLCMDCVAAGEERPGDPRLVGTINNRAHKVWAKQASQIIDDFIRVHHVPTSLELYQQLDRLIPEPSSTSARPVTFGDDSTDFFCFVTTLLLRRFHPRVLHAMSTLTSMLLTFAFQSDGDCVKMAEQQAAEGHELAGAWLNSGYAPAKIKRLLFRAVLQQFVEKSAATRND